MAKFPSINLFALSILLIICCTGSFSSPVRNKRLVCKIGQRRCGTQCYSFQQKCLGGNTVCNLNERLCGTQCYGLEQRCFEGKYVCNRLERLCGTECYGVGDRCFLEVRLCII